jgi:hypothetical protein
VAGESEVYGVEVDLLEKHLASGLSIRKIANIESKSYTTVRYWIHKHGLEPIGQRGPRESPCCIDCGTENEDEFYTITRKRVTKSYEDWTSRCKTCHNKERVSRMKKIKLAAVEHLGGKCVKCGYDKVVEALDFHHRDPNEKDPNFKYFRSWSLEKVLEEVSKCDLLCSNCHREEHAKSGLQD